MTYDFEPFANFESFANFEPFANFNFGSFTFFFVGATEKLKKITHKFFVQIRLLIEKFLPMKPQNPIKFLEKDSFKSKNLYLKIENLRN
jgi:hypothetical protein